MEENEYQRFVNKFKRKPTTDDCHTPPAVYEAVVEWLREEGLIEAGTQIVRPFWPGADYTRTEYPEGCVVVDNPPFSIYAEIVRWYTARGVRFFLFCPAMTGLRAECTLVATDTDIVYENGAKINTDFATNLIAGDPVAVTAPGLRRKLAEAVRKTTAETKKQLRVLAWPDCVLRVATLNTLASSGVALRIERSEGRVMGKCTTYGKGEYGRSIVLSTAATARKLAAERKAAERLELSAAARAAVAELDGQTVAVRERGLFDGTEE